MLQPRPSLETINGEYSPARAESTVNVKQVRDSEAIVTQNYFVMLEALYLGSFLHLNPQISCL